MKPRKPIKRKSAKGKRLAYADGLQSQVLRIKRGSKCEICGRPGHCVFHIAEKGQSSYPRIRYHEYNLLWTCWSICHAPWHHYGRNHPKVEYIHRRIQQLRGEKYWQDLMMLNQQALPMTPFQLEMNIAALQQELKTLQGR